MVSLLQIFQVLIKFNGKMRCLQLSLTSVTRHNNCIIKNPRVFPASRSKILCLRVCSAGSSPAVDAPEVVNLKIPHGSGSIANKAKQVSPCGANFELRHLGRLEVTSCALWAAAATDDCQRGEALPWPNNELNWITTHRRCRWPHRSRPAFERGSTASNDVRGHVHWSMHQATALCHIPRLWNQELDQEIVRNKQLNKIKSTLTGWHSFLS